MIEDYKKDAKAYLLENEGTLRSREKIISLDKNVKFENGKILYKDIQFGNYDEETRVIKVDRQKALDKKGLNPLLKHPSYPPSTTIIVTDGKNTHTYNTDEKGRIIKAESAVNEIAKSRVSDEQTKGKLFGDEDGYVDTNPKEKDQGGHRLAASAGGIPEVINTYAQAHSLNNGKENRDNERDCVRALKKDGSFKLTQTFEYEETRRPTKITSTLNNNSPIKFINLNIKPQVLNVPTFPKIKSTVSANNSVNILKEKKVWITSLLALLCLMLIYGVSLYNDYSDDLKKNKLETNLKITNKIQKTIPKTNKIDVSENLTLSNVNILFDKKSSSITKENYALLQKIVDTIIKNERNYSFSIEGYSCDLGTNIYNDNLSKLRAKNIETYFLEKGVDSSKIKISWFGETKFNSNGDLENSRKMSRRVIIKTKE